MKILRTIDGYVLEPSMPDIKNTYSNKDYK
jgi:hypothetical protein